MCFFVEDAGIVFCASHRAFEDDDCVAVIEQSPDTAHTQARPPGPSLVTVQMEPTYEDFQEDSHLVTVETYPEPILDTKVWKHIFRRIGGAEVMN